MFQYLNSAFKGPKQALVDHDKAINQHPDIYSGITELQNQCTDNINNDTEEPIFLMSAGWRSGSTLLQRLIMSDPQVLMWGEPYDECGIIQAMAETTKAFRPNWPPADYFYTGTPKNELSNEWVANLFPSLDELKNSHRTFFDTLFAEPAKKAGASRWGIKEVRLGTEHCAYLRWLYPKARFVFLYRNPLEAYISYCRYGRNWYNTFPDSPVFTPTAFGKHWKCLMEGFLKDATQFNAFLVSYEDLISGHTSINDLNEFLNININPNVLNNKVGSSEVNGGKAKVTVLEKWLLKHAVSPVAEDLGYKW